MTSAATFEVVVHRYDHDTSTNDMDSEEKRKDLRKMLENYEHVFDGSDDETDKNSSNDRDDQDHEGGIRAWNSMRRCQNAKKAATSSQETSQPPFPRVTSEIPLHDNSSVHVDHTCKDEDTLTVLKVIECNSESSTDREEITPTESEFQQSSCEDNVALSTPEDSAVADLCDVPDTSQSIDGCISIPSQSAAATPCESLGTSLRSSDDYIEYYSKGCRVMKGGFKSIKEQPQPKTLSEPFIIYPPLSNDGYVLTSTAHDPKFEPTEELANPVFVSRSYIKILEDSLLYSMLEPTFQKQPPFKYSPDKKHAIGEHLVGLSNGVPICGSPSSPQQDDSPVITNMLCGKCGARHIPSGWLCSLGERDSCGSYLPDWFPAENCENAWLTFTDFCNDINRLESLERGFTTRARKWNKIFHDEHPVWKVVGFNRGGWWRCRSGPNAPGAEQECHDCHVEYPVGDFKYAHMRYTNHETMDIAMETLKALRDFIDARMHQVSQKDKAIALDMIRETMTPRIGTSQLDLHAVGIGRASNWAKAQESEEEKGPKSPERMILEAMWNHRGPISTLDVPISPAFSFDGFADHDLDTYHGQEDDTGIMMKATLRQPRPAPLSFHRRASSFGSNFFSAFRSSPKSPSLLTPSTISPAMPLCASIPEEDVQISAD